MPSPSKLKFQADADLDGRLIRGLARAYCEIDIRTSASAGLPGLNDLTVLRIAADSQRILVSQDRRTMPGHFAQFIQTQQSSGLIILKAATPMSTAIEELALIWSASTSEEWINRLLWIPL
jgi:hypothetical protein